MCDNHKEKEMCSQRAHSILFLSRLSCLLSFYFHAVTCTSYHLWWWYACKIIWANSLEFFQLRRHFKQTRLKNWMTKTNITTTNPIQTLYINSIYIYICMECLISFHSSRGLRFIHCIQLVWFACLGALVYVCMWTCCIFV